MTEIEDAVRFVKLLKTKQIYDLLVAIDNDRKLSLNVDPAILREACLRELPEREELVDLWAYIG